MRRINLQAKPIEPQKSLLSRLGLRLAGTLLSPVYYAAAAARGLPGLHLQRQCVGMGLRLWPSPLASHWLVPPVLLTRYFEFDLAWRSLINFPAQRYLDVSSPYAFPLLLLSNRPQLRADLLNPDKNDLALTTQLVAATQLNNRCKLHGCLIEDAPFEPETFDIITSISVVEHIPDNTRAIAALWRLLRPGGKLILTVPCAAQPYEVYDNQNHYGLQNSDAQGFSFLEYVYDEQLLRDWIFCITGPPTQQTIYGERRSGWLHEELIRRWSSSYWRFWREPYLMSQTFMAFSSLSKLPGEGVISMEFVKA